jgi:hypothetical protein
MLDIDESVFIKTHQDLATKILQAINSESRSERDPSHFFELDASLPRWKGLINKKLSNPGKLINNEDD